MPSEYEHTYVSPTFIEHGSLFTTAIRITQFDPRVGGYYRDTNGDYQYQASYGPTFPGELCAFYKYVSGIKVLNMLCAYDSGSGLEWKPINGNRTYRRPFIDIRTNDVYDPNYPQRCMPPWVCE